jgi:hypothetical protein
MIAKGGTDLAVRGLRMRWLALPVALPAVLLLAACSTDVGPSAAELEARWNAQNVVPPNYKQDLLAFLRTYLNDPTQVRDTGVTQPALKRAGPGDRYVACVRYNSRDDRGKYTGVKDGAAIYVSGKLDRFVDGKEALPLCKDAAYAPFPELARLTR